MSPGLSRDVGGTSLFCTMKPRAADDTGYINLELPLCGRAPLHASQAAAPMHVCRDPCNICGESSGALVASEASRPRRRENPTIPPSPSSCAKIITLNDEQKILISQ